MTVENSSQLSQLENFRRLSVLGEFLLRIHDPDLRQYYAKQSRDNVILTRYPISSVLPLLTPQERERYSRQIFFAGEENQQRLKGATITVLGAGGVGAPCLYYLAAAGIGHLRFIDKDVVERSNLNRQILYGENDLGLAKAEAARARLADLNPDIKLDAKSVTITSTNADDLVRGSDFVILAMDDISIGNDVCARLGIPFAVPTAITSSFRGWLFVSGPDGRAPCLECALNLKYHQKIGPERTTGVFGIVPGIIGIMAALEAIKHILVLPRQVGTYSFVDMWRGGIKSFTILPRPGCPSCCNVRPTL